MKTYRGDLGPPVSISVSADGDDPVPFADGADFTGAWSQKLMTAASTNLIRALAIDAGVSKDMTDKVLTRLKWRLIPIWSSSIAPWYITDAEIRAQVDVILKVEAETQQTRAMVAREPAPVVMESGQGIGWTKAEGGPIRGGQ